MSTRGGGNDLGVLGLPGGQANNRVQLPVGMDSRPDQETRWVAKAFLYPRENTNSDFWEDQVDEVFSNP